METNEPDDIAGPSAMPSFAEWAAAQSAPAPSGDRDGDTALDAAPKAGREDGRGIALVCAAGWSMLFGVLMLASAAMTASSAETHYLAQYTDAAVLPEPPPYLLWLLAIGGTCWAACTAAELLHASKLASDYPPRGPWARLPASPAVRAARRATSGLNRVLGGGCLGIGVLVIIAPAMVIAWSLFTATSAPLWILVAGGATLIHLTSSNPAAAGPRR